MTKSKLYRLAVQVRRVCKAAAEVRRALYGRTDYQDAIFRGFLPRSTVTEQMERLRELSRRFKMDCVEMGRVFESYFNRPGKVYEGAEYVAKEIRMNKESAERTKQREQAAPRTHHVSKLAKLAIKYGPPLEHTNVPMSRPSADLLLKALNDGDDLFFRRLGKLLDPPKKRQLMRKRRNELLKWQDYVERRWTPRTFILSDNPEAWPTQPRTTEFWPGFAYFGRTALVSLLKIWFPDEDWSLTRDSLRSFADTHGLLRVKEKSQFVNLKDETEFLELLLIASRRTRRSSLPGLIRT